MKKCPFCAEEIQDAAIVCRFCQRPVAPARPPAPDAHRAEVRRQNMRAVKILGGVILAAIVLGMLSALIRTPTPAGQAVSVADGTKHAERERLIQQSLDAGLITHARSCAQLITELRRARHLDPGS